MRKGRNRTQISSLVLQAAMTTTYILIPLLVVTREVGAEGAEEEGAMAPALILPLTLLPIISSDYLNV